MWLVTSLQSAAAVSGRPAPAKLCQLLLPALQVVQCISYGLTQDVTRTYKVRPAAGQVSSPSEGMRLSHLLRMSMRYGLIKKHQP